MILAIDFDGVIHDKEHPVSGRRMGPPIDGAVAAMTALKAAGHKLIVHSVWADTLAGQKTMGGWLEFYKIPFDEVTNLKPQADVYLDDKAVRFTTWGQFRNFIGIDGNVPHDLTSPAEKDAKELWSSSPETSYAEQCRRAFFGR